MGFILTGVGGYLLTYSNWYENHRDNYKKNSKENRSLSDFIDKNIAYDIFCVFAFVLICGVI